MSTSAAAGWTAALAAALAAFGLGGWFGYVLGRNAKPSGTNQSPNNDESQETE
jgi:membrane protein YqaA with SNARE-associated domain